MVRKYPLVTGEIYHVMNKSIAGYEIFNRPNDYVRMLRLLRYFTLAQPPSKFSYFLNNDPVVREKGFESCFKEEESNQKEMNADIIAYALMPTHVHVLLKQRREGGIAAMMGNALNSYTKYFNTKYSRQGVLWSSRFKNVPLDDDEQLHHVVRYIHLNPTTAGLVKNPEEWPHSSYREYITPDEVEYPLIRNEGLFDMTPQEQKHFTEDQKDYQRELALIKNQILE